MRRISGFSMLALCAIALSCGVKESKTEYRGVTFAMEKFRKQSGNCSNDSTSCAFYEVNFPVFTGLPDSIHSTLKKKIDATVSMGNPEAGDWTMEMIAENFIKSYESFAGENPELSPASWYYKANYTVELLTDTLVSLSMTDEFFTGGAHGGGGKYFISINPVNGKDVVLKDVLSPGYEEPIRVEGERIFRATYHLPDTASLLNNGFEFPQNKFELNQNYGFSKEGIVFVYNSYEIASYAQGPTEITIPYEKIRAWLRTNP